VNLSLKYNFLFIFLVVFLASCTKKNKLYEATPDVMPVIKPITFHDDMIADARLLKGCKYCFGGTSPEGFDCSGFVQYVFRENGVELPRMVIDLARYGRTVSVTELRHGDLVFFKTKDKLTHVAIVTNVEGKLPSIIHSSTKYGVSELDLDDSIYWKPKIAFFRRVYE